MLHYILGKNYALNQNSWQINQLRPNTGPKGANDGKRDTNFDDTGKSSVNTCMMTKNTNHPWYAVELSERLDVGTIRLTGRDMYDDRLDSVIIKVSDTMPPVNMGQDLAWQVGILYTEIINVKEIVAGKRFLFSAGVFLM